MTKRYPVTPTNSTVLGHDARSPLWRKWWRDLAVWRLAYPCRGGVAPLNVPVRYMDGAVYRVRPKLARVQSNIGSVRVERVRGVWFWIYPEKT